MGKGKGYIYQLSKSFKQTPNMINKVLVSDDLSSSNQGVFTILKKLGIRDYHQVQYCDDAYLQIKKSTKEGSPYDLLITDLYFKKDHRNQTLENGESLIKVIKRENPNLKIIVYSDEDRYLKIKQLFTDYNIDAYIVKGRLGLSEIDQAINLLGKNGNFLSPQISQAINNNMVKDITEYDIELLTQLSHGFSQEEISQTFKQMNIAPSSLSSIEKRLNKLRINFKANNAIHLVAIVKDLGLI